jgi:hypothetical protein
LYLILDHFELLLVLSLEQLHLRIGLVLQSLLLFTNLPDIGFLIINTLAHLLLKVDTNLCLLFIDAVELSTRLGVGSLQS